MVGRRRVDFLILGKRLIFVEIDGAQHYKPDWIKADRTRDEETYPILGHDSLCLWLSNGAVCDGTAEETLRQLFRYKTKPSSGLVKSRLVSPVAANSFYTLLRHIFSGEPGIRKGCSLVTGRRIMPVAPSPTLRTALGTYMRRTAEKDRL